MSSAFSSAENFFDSMGMMRGNTAAIKRGVFGAAVGYVAMQAVRPSFAYYADGTPRPWSISQTAADLDADPSADGQHGTALPWWTGPAAGAFVCSVLI